MKKQPKHSFTRGIRVRLWTIVLVLTSLSLIVVTLFVKNSVMLIIAYSSIFLAVYLTFLLDAKIHKLKWTLIIALKDELRNHLTHQNSIREIMFDYHKIREKINLVTRKSEAFESEMEKDAPGFLVYKIESHYIIPVFKVMSETDRKKVFWNLLAYKEEGMTNSDDKFVFACTKYIMSNILEILTTTDLIKEWSSIMVHMLPNNSLLSAQVNNNILGTMEKVFGDKYFKQLMEDYKTRLEKVS